MDVPATPQPAGHMRLLLVLVGVVALMLVVAFVVLPPIYNFFCRAGGGQYQPNNQSLADAAPVATGRYIEVFFESKVFDNLPVRFWADQERQTIEVGGQCQNVYHFQNLSDQPVRFRPVHQVNPSQVAKSFAMPVCFCFNDQEIGPGESRDWPVVYKVGVDADPRIKDMTICYSLLSLVTGESKEAAETRVKSATAGQGDIVTPRFKDLNEARP
jgi:cytochrome c oxidase assembly protein subunit 11